jgi:large subunit ribosomal protein L7/L12
MNAVTEYDPSLALLGDTIANLESTDALRLRTYLEEEYGIVASSGSIFAPEPTTFAPVLEVVEEQTSFDVILKAVSDPAKKIGVIKVVRQATGLGLAESKAAVDAAPKTLKEALPKAEAEKLKKEIEDAGGIVELK